MRTIKKILNQLVVEINIRLSYNNQKTVLKIEERNNYIAIDYYFGDSCQDNLFCGSTKEAYNYLLGMVTSFNLK